jgi:hypothetical protein
MFGGFQGKKSLTSTAVVQQVVLPGLLAIALVMFVFKNGKKFVRRPQLAPSLAQPW